jgi:hypothetical protein
VCPAALADFINTIQKTPTAEGPGGDAFDHSFQSVAPQLCFVESVSSDAKVL